MITGKYIKKIIDNNSDALAYVVMQCIISLFIIILINLLKQVDNYSDIGLEIWIFIRTSFVFLLIKLLNIKCKKFSRNSLYILLGCFLFDFMLNKLVFIDNLLLYNLIAFSFGAYLPFFILSICKCIFDCFIKGISNTKKIYYKYCFLLTILLLLNCIVPIFISSLFFIVEIKVMVVIFILYQVVFSKFISIITFIIAIFLQKSIFYRKRIAPFLAYIIVFGSIFDITLYTKFSNSLFQIKNNLIMPISFIATFLPMFIVYKLSFINNTSKSTKYPK